LAFHDTAIEFETVIKYLDDGPNMQDREIYRQSLLKRHLLSNEEHGIKRRLKYKHIQPRTKP
jgi:hypothetical protein